MAEQPGAVQDRQSAAPSPSLPVGKGRPGLPPHLGRLPVQLSVDLGVVRLTMRQLLGLGAGTRLHVTRGRLRQLVVRVQERALLAGALVDREGRLAVRLSAPGGEQ